MIYGFEAADGYDLVTERTRMFYGDLMEQRDDGVMLLAEPIVAARDRRLEMLIVRYLMVTAPSPKFDAIAAQAGRFQAVFAQRSVALFENKTMLPRAWAVPLAGAEVLTDVQAQVVRLKDPAFDPEQTVLVGSEPAGVSVGAASPTPGNGHVEVVGRGANHVELRLEVRNSSVIVLSQMY
jgi:hypothetical protein